MKITKSSGMAKGTGRIISALGQDVNKAPISQGSNRDNPAFSKDLYKSNRPKAF